MGVSMTGQDRRAWRSGKCARFRIAGAEGQCSAVCVIHHDQIDVHRRHLQLRDRKCIGPGPRFDGCLAGQRAGPGSLQQILCKPGLRIDPRSFPDLPKPDGDEAHRQDEESAGSGADGDHATRFQKPHTNHANVRVANPIKSCSCPLVAPFASSLIETLSSIFALAGCSGSVAVFVGRAGVTSTATRLVYLLTRWWANATSSTAFRIASSTLPL